MGEESAHVPPRPSNYEINPRSPLIHRFSLDRLHSGCPQGHPRCCCTRNGRRRACRSRSSTCYTCFSTRRACRSRPGTRHTCASTRHTCSSG